MVWRDALQPHIVLKSSCSEDRFWKELEMCQYNTDAPAQQAILALKQAFCKK